MIKNLLVAVIFVSSVNHALAVRDEIRVVGSPEILPYVQRVAQNFTLVSEFAAPSLAVTGTGNEFKLFCDGIGFEYPDINAASRRITDSEFAMCQTNGVELITEIAVGLDGIVNVRKDNAFVTGIKNDGLMVKWLQEHPDAFGILPFLLYQENDDVIAANAINGVAPTAENITNGRYTLARPIYLYVKTKHVDAVKGLQKFLYEFTSEHAIGPDGYLAEKGFIPLMINAAILPAILP